MTIAETVFALTDTETTRKDPADPEQEVIEVCVGCIRDDAHTLDNRHGYAAHAQYTSRIFAVHPIPPESSGIHHITEGDLIGMPTREQVDEELLEFLVACPMLPVPVAHNAPFDKAVLGNKRNGLGALEWLCTQRMAQHLVPDAPNFKLGTLFYLFGGTRPPVGNAHGAAFDVAMLVTVFVELLRRYRAFAKERCAGDAERLAKSEQIDTLLAFVRRPIVMTKFPNFGKHAGVLLADIPTDYYEWCLSPRGLTDMDDDLRFNIEREVTRRSGRML